MKANTNKKAHRAGGTVQTVLVNRKRKVSLAQQRLWDDDRHSRLDICRQNIKLHNKRLQKDPTYALRMEEKKRHAKEKIRRQKEDKMRSSDIDLLFENFFGNKNEWGPIYKNL